MSEQQRRNPGLERGQPIEPDLAQGLMTLHERLGSRVVAESKLSAHVYALTELLISKGIVSLKEFEERKTRSLEQQMQEMNTHWEGAEVLTDPTDKYSVEPVQIDCQQRLHLCKAACCRLHFTLSPQDLEEGFVRFNVRRPFHIAQREDGWCSHCDKGTKRCNVHANRPIICRTYDCRKDARIWESFDEMIPHPDLARLY
jgi:Fe-S-cluster containining protein